MNTSCDYEHTCPECFTWTQDGSWCADCLDKVDLDEHEARRRERIAEEQEY